MWVGNVYVPPAQNLTKRNVPESVAQSFVEDIVGTIPCSDASLVCGDWNARLGNLSPTVGEVTIPRLTTDHVVCARAPWVIELCTQQGWLVLNGA